jgi:hypothetical protein
MENFLFHPHVHMRKMDHINKNTKQKERENRKLIKSEKKIFWCEMPTQKTNNWKREKFICCFVYFFILLNIWMESYYALTVVFIELEHIIYYCSYLLLRPRDCASISKLSLDYYIQRVIIPCLVVKSCNSRTFESRVLIIIVFRATHDD